MTLYDFIADDELDDDRGPWLCSHPAGTRGCQQAVLRPSGRWCYWHAKRANYPEAGHGQNSLEQTDRLIKGHR